MSYTETGPNGTYKYKLIFHNDKGPARVGPKPGDEEWFINGKRHRAGGLPAVIREKGAKRTYYVDGKLHRDDDLPAIDFPELKEWYVHGLRHREGDKPAVISTKNGNQYFCNGHERRPPLPL